jgi:mannan endo-1,4-beta-mannosidase
MRCPDDTLAVLDTVLAQLASYGMKAIISPHDAGVICGVNGHDAYCSKYGSSDNFYSSIEAKQDYDNRMAAILNYVSPSSGKKWAEWWEAIMAFDIQNEPMIGSIGKLQNNDPDDWLCGRAGNMKKIIGNSGVRIATGGVGGSEYCCVCFSPTYLLTPSG